MLRKVALVAVLVLPFAAWAFAKPVRVLAPQLEGLTCDHGVCVDDPARRAEAAALYRDALQYVQASLGPMEAQPRAVFCSTAECARKFGFKRQNAYNCGTFAIVIGNRGWQPFFVRHELIPHVQNEHLGSLQMWLLKPVWFREGMAYSLSGDPRHPLPQPLEGYRAEFETWYQKIGPSKLWQEASEL